jgi:hypothetical protein
MKDEVRCVNVEVHLLAAYDAVFLTDSPSSPEPNLVLRKGVMQSARGKAYKIKLREDVASVNHSVTPVCFL